jgi:hypothetical protein
MRSSTATCPSYRLDVKLRPRCRPTRRRSARTPRRAFDADGPALRAYQTFSEPAQSWLDSAPRTCGCQPDRFAPRHSLDETVGESLAEDARPTCLTVVFPPKCDTVDASRRSWQRRVATRCWTAFTSTTRADVSPHPFGAKMHDDDVRSLKESRRFERMSSTTLSTTSTADWYSLRLPATEMSSLHASVFSSRYRLPSRSRGTRH